MKALSILQPWSDAILLGAKRVENRTWSTRYRGELLVHAGKGFDNEGMECVMGRYADAGIAGMRPLLSAAPRRRGALLGIVTLVDCVPIEAVPHKLREWACGPWCWIVENPRHLPAPIPYKGERGLFEVPDDVVADAMRSLWIERIAS